MTPPPAQGRNIGPKLLAALIAALVLIIFLAAMLEFRARNELERARAHASAREFTAADRHYFQTLNWYAPWGASQTAADELLALGVSHLSEGREEEAFQSLLRLRAGLIAARSLYQPRQEILDAATPLIALILARKKLGEAADPSEITAQATIYQELYVSAAANPQEWLVLIVLSFLLWVAAAFQLVFAYFSGKKPFPTAFKRKAIYLPLGIFAFAYLLWILSMGMS